MIKKLVAWLRQDNDDQPREKAPATPSSTNNDLYDSTSDPEQASDPVEVRQQKSQYPEGGLAANLVVFGSFCSIMGGLGLMNSIGIYQSWISSHQLRHVSEGQRAWIFGIYNFMVFFCGIQIGPVFDAHGPRWLMLSGLLLYVATFVALGFCSLYWHFIIVVGVVAGAATSIIFVVPVATIGQYFNVRRGAATGLAMSGGSLGGVMFPLIFDALGDRVGFAWTTRVIGLVTVVLLLVGCVMVRPRSKFRKQSQRDQSILPDFKILCSPAIFLVTAGVFFIEWGFFVGLEYVSSYALAHGIGRRLSYLMVVFLNAGSFPGRWLPGIMADKFGRMNTLLLTNVLCMISMLAIWLPAGSNVGAIITFAVVFGFASGSNISLVPVCVGEYCTTQNYGRYYTTVYTVVSFGALTGVPIAGEIVSSSGGSYQGLIIFAGASYFAGVACFSAVMWLNRRQRSS